MTPPEFSLLLLAWDDADPSVAVLGGSALPPTLPLVYQLAAQQPVLAVYPHLPAAEIPSERTMAADMAATLPDETPETNETAPTAAKEALETTVAISGVRLLPGPVNAEGRVASAAPQLRSRVVGLAELWPGSSSPHQPVDSPLPAALNVRPLAPTHSQWPTEANALVPGGHWQAPAAPYLGAEPATVYPPPPPAPPRAATAKRPATTSEHAKTALPAAEQLPAATALASEVVRPILLPITSAAEAPIRADDLSSTPAPEQPAVRHPVVFDEPTEELGAAEANDLSAPEDNVTLDEPAEATRVEPSPAPALPAPAERTPAPLIEKPNLDGLNFRMIQYARQAAQLVRGRQDFGVIYAPSWPAWLAALEIRNSSGQPLVLYVAAAAIDFTSPAERGWLLELERITLRRAALTLVPDEAVRRRLLGLYGDIIGEVRVVAAADEEALRRVLREVANE